MGGADKSSEQVQRGLDAAQVLQERYDEVGWELGDSSHEKLRHLCLHLAKTVGIVAAVSEQFDHRAGDGTPPTDGEVAEELKLISGRAADLASFAAQIATLAEANLGELFIGRVRENVERLAPDSDVARQLTAAESDSSS
jgi:hypothetical protein